MEKRIIAVRSLGNLGTFLSEIFSYKTIPEKNVDYSINQKGRGEPCAYLDAISEKGLRYESAVFQKILIDFPSV